MAKNVSNKKTNHKNNRPNCLKVTKGTQRVNLQPIKVIKDGKVITVRSSVREIRAAKKQCA